MADLIKLWLYPNMTPRIWLSQIYLWKDKIMRYLFIFISLKYVFIRDNTWRDKIMRHLLMLISFKRCLIRMIQRPEERDGQTSHTPPSKTSWLLDFFFYVKFFSMPLHDATWTEGYLIWIRHTYLMALWPLDARMAQDQREEKKRCFMKQLSTHLFVKIQIWWKIVSFLLRHVPNREESLLTWRDASHIP